MRNCKDKKQQRYQLVIYALDKGIKPAARTFNTSRPTVRKWIKRFKQNSYQGLSDLSRRPHCSPRRTIPALRDNAIRLKKKYKRLGAEQIKAIEDPGLSTKTLRKIWRDAGISSRKRRKKYQTKRNLREVKKQFKLFEFNCEDTKDLIDIPEYWPYMKKYRLPKVQYTFREVSCGIQFTGFAEERSINHAALFAGYINNHLKQFNLHKQDRMIRQTDNGIEYCGPWSSKKPSIYTLTIETLPGQKHATIFPRAHRMQADVETVHNLIEMEFYELEKFKDKADFINKANSYQLFFNLERPNTYKENKTPWQLAQEKIPGLDKRALMLPAVDLDTMLESEVNFLAQGGKDVLTNP
jgi:transposase